VRIWEAVLVRTAFLISVLLIALTSSAYAHHFDHGRAAYNSGDYVSAFHIFSDLAEHGHPIAQANLSMMYFRGTGAPMDYALAVDWALRAAEQGYAVAQTQLGYIYLNAGGDTRDHTKAAKWYRRAAEQGFAVAQTTLGTLYYQGIGVAEDYTEAVKWFRLGAEQCNADAHAKLGVAYLQGEGVNQSLTQAYVLFSIAQDLGHQSTTKILKFLATQMTSAEILTAERMVRVRQKSRHGAAATKDQGNIERDFLVGRELYPDRYR
jgi:TPR repeat protein